AQMGVLPEQLPVERRVCVVLELLSLICFDTPIALVFLGPAAQCVSVDVDGSKPTVRFCSRGRARSAIEPLPRTHSGTQVSQFSGPHANRVTVVSRPLGDQRPWLKADPGLLRCWRNPPRARRPTLVPRGDERNGEEVVRRWSGLGYDRRQSACVLRIFWRGH